MAWRTWALAAIAASMLAVTIYFLTRTNAPPLTLACPLQIEERAQHPGMVWIPRGTVEMGSDIYPEETRRTVTVDGFWIDHTEVTNAEFAEFVRATNYVTVAERKGTKGAAVFVLPSGNADLSTAASWWRYVEGANWRHPGGPDTSIDGREHFPVVAIAYEDAAAYAKWTGRRLPTEAEWEHAARAGAAALPEREQPNDANTWQGVFPLINTSEDGFTGVAPVGCFKPNALGVHDMIGNVWEFTTDTFENQSPPAHVIKGGSFLCAPNYCLRYRAAARQPQEDGLGTSHVGFRTVLDAPTSASTQP
ncbi:MAG: formylglycine-generating enzyme family protein [Alphaproteobacteria bacterium]|nr:formylglycine-generating enzyme family protein [Alphaproteobacteria bacterium]